MYSTRGLFHSVTSKGGENEFFPRRVAKPIIIMYMPICYCFARSQNNSFTDNISQPCNRIDFRTIASRGPRVAAAFTRRLCATYAENKARAKIKIFKKTIYYMFTGLNYKSNFYFMNNLQYNNNKNKFCGTCIVDLVVQEKSVGLCANNAHRWYLPRGKDVCL